MKFHFNSKTESWHTITSHLFSHLSRIRNIKGNKADLGYFQPCLRKETFQIKSMIKSFLYKWQNNLPDISLIWLWLWKNIAIKIIARILRKILKIGTCSSVQLNLFIETHVEYFRKLVVCNHPSFSGSAWLSCCLLLLILIIHNMLKLR